MPTVASTEPYPWPYDAVMEPSRLALIIAGAQRGWATRSRGSERVHDVVGSLAAELRRIGALVVAVHHGHDGPPRPSGLPPRRGSEDWQPLFAPAEVDVAVEAGGISAFHGSVLDDVLRSRGVDHLVLAGFGHEAAVDSTLRGANDRGFECLVLSDAVASFQPELGARALASVTMSGGIFGALGTSTDLLDAFRAFRRPASSAPTLEVVL